MKNAIRILAAILLVIPLAAQQPQTSAPVFRANAKYVNGMAPGYWPTAGSGMTLNLSAGTANCAGTMVTYAAGTLTMTASTTNYVYLNTAASCVPAVKTTGFTSSDITVATVVTSGSAITSIADDRTIFQAPGSGGGGGGGAVWGGITGSIASQADLEAALGTKAAAPLNSLSVTSAFSISGGQTYDANCSAACTGTLPATVTTGFSAIIFNKGTANVTIATGGPTYDGVTTMPPGIALGVYTDGTMYHSSLPTTHFSGCTLTPALTGNTLTCSGSGITSTIPVENYGAVGYATQAAAVAGTDSTTAIQNCLNVLTPGQACLLTSGYKILSTLTMPATTGIGLVGLSPSSFLITTSASADMIDDHGTSLSARNNYHTYLSFQLYRSVTPTGTAAGISQQYTGGTIINQVGANDSFHPFYFLGTASLGYGYIANSAASWGFGSASGLTGSCGFYLDTSTGVAMDSFKARNITASQNFGNATEYDGVCLVGTLMSDVDVTGIEAGVLTHAVKIVGSGTTANAFQDIHFRALVLDECLSSCIYVSGIPNSGTYNYSAIEFNGGYVSTDNQLLWGYPNYAIDVENSSGVTFANLQVLGSNLAAFYLNGSTDISITGAICKSGLASGAHGGCVLLNNSNGNVISSSILNSVVDVAGTNVSFVNSSNNVFQGNKIGGYNALGVNFDSASNNNLWLTSNSIDTTNITTAYTDAGSGNEQSSSTVSVNGTSVSSPNFQGTTPAAPSGAVNNVYQSSVSSVSSYTPAATGSTPGVIKPDGSSCTVTSGVLTCTGSSGATTIAICADTSGSGTAQSCTTSPSFTPVAGSVIAYTTSTANTGTGLTINVNSLGAKSVAKWQATTSLAAGDIKANVYILMIYDGTNWETSTIGNAPSGGGGSPTNLCSIVSLTNATCSGGVISFSSMNSPGFTISAIPGTFNNLRGHIKGACTAAANSNIIATLNSDTTTAHYNCQITAFASSTTNKSATCSASSVTGGTLLGEMGGSGGIGSTDFIIPAYADSNQKSGTAATYESTQPLSGEGGWSWSQTSAITSIQFITQGSCAASGTMTLYGEQ